MSVGAVEKRLSTIDVKINVGKIVHAELGERTGLWLRELATCGQRESGGGIHAT